MLAEQPIIDEILKFFSDKLEPETNAKGFNYAAYKTDWLEQLGLNSSSPDESKTARTLKKLQDTVLLEFGKKRIKLEARVAENMQLRFIDRDLNLEEIVDTSSLMAFDILDLESGCAFEISLPMRSPSSLKSF